MIEWFNTSTSSTVIYRRGVGIGIVERPSDQSQKHWLAQAPGSGTLVVHTPSDSLRQHASFAACQLVHHFYIFCRRSVGISGISWNTQVTNRKTIG
jgi:hypothetical protein